MLRSTTGSETGGRAKAVLPPGLARHDVLPSSCRCRTPGPRRLRSIAPPRSREFFGRKKRVAIQTRISRIYESDCRADSDQDSGFEHPNRHGTTTAAPHGRRTGKQRPDDA